MKTRLFLFALMLGAWSLSGCSKDDTAESARPENGTITLTFPVEDPAAPQSRTAVKDDGTIGFTASENMTAHVWAVVNGAKVKSAIGKIATRKAGTPSTVTVTHNAVTDATEYGYVFVSPNTNAAKIDETAFNTLTIHLRESQTPTAASFDAKQDVLISKPVTVAVTDPAGTTNQAQLEAVQFKRLFTFFRLTIDRSIVPEIPAGEQIRSVSIEALDPTTVLSGDATVPVTDDPAQLVATFTATSNRVTADYGAAGADFTGDKFDAWLVVNPATFTGMRIRIRTTTKVITQTLDTFTCDLQANTINTMTFRYVNTPAIVSKIANYTDYYADGVTIDGATYDSTTAGAMEVAAGGTISFAANNIFFVTSALTPASSQSITKDIAIIGRYSDERAKLPFQAYWALRNAGGKVIFKNVDIDFAAFSEAYSDTFYCFNVTTGTQAGGVGKLLFEDCNLSVPSKRTLLTLNGMTSPRCPERIVFKNCKIRLGTPTATYYFINLDNAVKDNTDLINLKEIRFENNVIYCPSDEFNSSLVSTVSNIEYTRAGAPNLDLTFTNNTLVNVGYYMGLFKFGNALKSVAFEKNILTHSGKDTALLGVSVDYATVSGTTAPLQTADNLTFGRKWRLNSTANTAITMPAGNECTNAADDPLPVRDLAAGTFTRSEQAVAGNYGSTLE
ncbi:hypothetical protein [Alistipes sp.]|uniref:hypothetical protein n=1 Tax=Alistipes sp. TaxID=1872444 RepID=UPI003AEF494C